MLKKLNMASRSSGKYTLRAKPLEPFYEVLEDELDLENDSEEEEDIIDLFNNIFDDCDDIVNNVFEQSDNHHPLTIMVMGKT